MGKAPQYTEEYKRNIVTLYRSGKSATEIIREYGLSQSALYKWIKKYGEIKISETETITADEIQKMRQRMARLEEENIILKKAMAIFTKGSANGSDVSED
jgi:transposase